MNWLSPDLQAWLNETVEATGTYRHTLLTEDDSRRSQGLDALRALAREAHRDGRERVAELFDDSLDPLARNAPSGSLPYPDALHTTTLQGYFGELLAGLIAENYAPHGRRWQVPAFLFRGHEAAYQDLERRRQLGGSARPIPGRTGDDALAFEMDGDGGIVAWLLGEAKCTYDHSAALIADAHEQLSSAIDTPVDLTQLIEVMKRSQHPDRKRWVAALRELLYTLNPIDRFDMCVYVCGRKPRRSDTWIGRDGPHERYRGSRPIQATEVHLDRFDEVLTSTYTQHTVSRA